jgi:hypothetical protein
MVEPNEFGDSEAQFEPRSKRKTSLLEDYDGLGENLNDIDWADQSLVDCKRVVYKVTR